MNAVLDQRPRVRPSIRQEPAAQPEAAEPRSLSDHMEFLASLRGGYGFVLGRGDESKVDIPVNHPSVSRQHALVIPLPSGEILLHDGVNGVPSKCGTYIQDETGKFVRITEPAVIKQGQAFRLGGGPVLTIKEKLSWQGRISPRALKHDSL